MPQTYILERGKRGSLVIFIIIKTTDSTIQIGVSGVFRLKVASENGQK